MHRRNLAERYLLNYAEYTFEKQSGSFSSDYFMLQLYAYSFRTAPISPRADVSPNSPPKKKKYFFFELLMIEEIILHFNTFQYYR